MTDLVRHHVGAGEFALRAEPAAQFIEEAEIEVHLLVGRAVERTHRRLGRAAAGAGHVPEQHQLRLPVLGAGFAEHRIPDIFRIGEDDADEVLLLGFGGRLLHRSGCARRAAGRGDLLLVQDGGRIAAQEHHDQGKHQRSHAAAHHRRTPHPRAAPVLDVFAFASALPLHDGAPI